MSSARRVCMGTVLLFALSLAPACDSSEASGNGSDESGGSSDGAMAPCNEQPTVTYDTFGRGFLSTYCDGCHGGAVIERQDAPADVVFDTREGAQMWSDRILARAAPTDGSEPTMPAVGGVTPHDRERLLVWLTCYP